MSIASNYALPEDATLGDLCLLLERGIRLGLHTVLPGRVKSFAAAVPGKSPATVFVEPSMSAVYWTLEGREVEKPLPPVPAAILGHWQSGGFRMTATPREGDTGILLTSERSLEEWRNSGGKPEPPRFVHTHALMDAFFLPVGRPGPDGLTVPATGLSLSTDTGSAPEPGEFAMDLAGNVTVEGPTIKLGRAAAAPTGQLALASALHTYLVQMVTQAAVAAMDGGATFKAAMLTFLATNPFSGPPFGFATSKTVAQ